MPNLARYLCFAVDTHWLRAGAHDERHDRNKVPVGQDALPTTMIGADTTFLVQLEWMELSGHQAAHALLQREVLQPQVPLALAPQVLAAKFPEALDRLESVLGRTQRLPTSARAALSAEVATVLPEKDRPVLAAAIRADGDALMTGDRTHFGSLYGRTVGGVTVHSPSGLAASVFGSGCRRPNG